MLAEAWTVGPTGVTGKTPTDTHRREATVAEKLIHPIAEACEMLGGISRALAYQLIDSGQLERVNIGRRAFITRASIEALAAAGTNPDAAA